MLKKKKDFKDKNLPIANEKIPGKDVQLINAEGVNEGIVSKFYAIDKAKTDGLDLVLLSQSGADGVPVTKIMDLGKALYEKKKKAGEAKKKQKIIKVKEIKLRPSIGDHDLNVKAKHAFEFLEDGMRIKLTLMFRGREMASKHELGPKLFEKFEAALNGMDVENLVFENDSKLGRFWSRVYYKK